MAKPNKPRRKRPAPIENNPVEDAMVAMLRVGLVVQGLLDRFFETYEITLLQFNILRILYVRDVEGEGLPAGSFAARMMTIAPDVPRMIDRLVKQELVERASSPTDRRVVLIKLTQKGIDVIEDSTPKLVEHNKELIGALPVADLRDVAKHLNKVLELVNEKRAER